MSACAAIRSLNLEKDLARSLGVASIRVVETIPGKTCMGLELPNPKRQMIRLSEIFNSPAFAESKSKLTLALGQDITGQPVVTDLAKRRICWLPVRPARVNRSASTP